ncbi:MAG: hypothetical protein IPK12_03335 [Gemmatimonadetes bacterium]|nr:hypothetical protein [Gemmatimonadota bacterium]
MRPSRAALLGTCLVASGPLAAQAPPVVVLSGATPIPAAEFTRVGGLVELTAETLLVSDPREGILWTVPVPVAGGRTARAAPAGDGPGDFRLPSKIYRGAADSIVVVDGQTQRFTVFSPVLRYARDFTVRRAAAFRVRGVDLAGAVYYEETLERYRGGGEGLNAGARSRPRDDDSVPALRLHAAAQVLDTVAWLRLPPPRRQQLSLVSEAPGGHSRDLPFGTQDDWAVNRAGLVAVVRGAGYTVDWYRAGRLERRSPPITRERVAVTEAEQDAWWATHQGDSIGTFTCNDPKCLVWHHPPRPTDWAPTKNPFEPRSLILTDEEEFWLQRAGDAMVRYDVVTPAGGQWEVRLPVGRRIVAVTGRWVYATWTDEDDVIRLERYRRPALSRRP